MSNNSESELIEYGSECYEVQFIRDRKLVRGKHHYLIKWEGWPEADNTWEPLENLQTVVKLVKEFDEIYDAKKSPKKTKLIEKDKKSRKIQGQKSQGEISQSGSESGSSQSSQKSKLSKKKMNKNESIKESNKKSTISENVEKSKLREKQRLKEKQKEKQKEKEKERELEKRKSIKESNANAREKEKEKQRLREKEKEKSSNNFSNKKNDSKTLIQKKQSQALTPLNKQSSAKMGFDQSPTDLIEITRINYHVMVLPENQSQTPTVNYNVDRRNRITKKSLPVAEISGQELIKKNVDLMLEYLEKFLIQVEICAMEEREYERKKNGEVSNKQGEVKLGLIGKMRK